jgi:uncharacterized protein (UPF0261 family)
MLFVPTACKEVCGKAVSRALNGGRSNEKVADKGLLIAVCRHIIVVTPELCSCVLTLAGLNN